MDWTSWQYFRLPFYAMMYLWLIPVALVLVVLMVILYKSSTKTQPNPPDRDVFHAPKGPDRSEGT